MTGLLRIGTYRRPAGPLKLFALHIPGRVFERKTADVVRDESIYGSRDKQNNDHPNGEFLSHVRSVLVVAPAGSESHSSGVTS